MSFHFAIPQNTCWRNLCRTDLPSLFIKLKWSITLDYCCITHGGIHESGRKSWSGMSSTFIIYFIVITIHCHHHSPSSSSTVIISTFSTALAAFSQSTMRHVRLKSIAFSASRHRLMIMTVTSLQWSMIAICHHFVWKFIVRGQTEFQRIFEKSKTSDDDYLAHLYNSK